MNTFYLQFAMDFAIILLAYYKFVSKNILKLFFLPFIHLHPLEKKRKGK